MGSWESMLGAMQALGFFSLLVALLIFTLAYFLLVNCLKKAKAREPKRYEKALFFVAAILLAFADIRALDRRGGFRHNHLRDCGRVPDSDVLFRDDTAAIVFRQAGVEVLEVPVTFPKFFTASERAHLFNATAAIVDCTDWRNAKVNIWKK